MSRIISQRQAESLFMMEVVYLYSSALKSVGKNKNAS